MFPAVVKTPPAYNAVPNAASAFTVLFVPLPSEDQTAPLKRAILETGTFPAWLNIPPAYKVLLKFATAYTSLFSPPAGIACQLTPSQVAILCAERPPAVVNFPAA